MSYEDASYSNLTEEWDIAPTDPSGVPPSTSSNAEAEGDTGISSTTSVSMDTTAKGRFNFIPSPVVVSTRQQEVFDLYSDLMGTLIKGESGISRLVKLPASAKDPAPSFRLNRETTCAAESRQSWNDDESGEVQTVVHMDLVKEIGVFYQTFNGDRQPLYSWKCVSRVDPIKMQFKQIKQIDDPSLRSPSDILGFYQSLVPGDCISWDYES
jgi:hypothetical protein